MKTSRGRRTRHWLQIHWPREKGGSGKQLHVWLNENNMAMKDQMASGDKVIFYQTRSNPDGLPGSGAFFATGSVTGPWRAIQPPIRRGGKRWLQKRKVTSLIRVDEDRGITPREAKQAGVSLSYRKSASLENEPFQIIERLLKTRQRENSNSKSPEKRYCRICWNGRKWRVPTGEAALLEKGTWVTRYGFGHEEWLFNFGYLINGLHYAHLQPVYNSWSKLQGQTIDIRLYSHCPKPIKGPAWVGEIRNCRVISEQEAQGVKSIYQKKGWFRELERDLARIRLTRYKLNKEEPLGLFNVCFSPQDAVLLEAPEPILGKHLLATAHRYELFHAKDVWWSSGSGKFDRKPPGSGKRKKEGRGSREIHAEFEVDYVHTRIQNQLADLLEAKYGKKQVAYEQDHVDVALNEKHSGRVRKTLFEIKTEPSAKMCIRQALGQLLEYSCYPSKCDARSLIVVGPSVSREEDMEYLAHIKSRFGIPVGYWQFDVEKGTVLVRSGVRGPNL